MNRKFNKIASLFLLVAFLLPSVVKMEHQHEHFSCKAKSEKHFHVFHEKCNVCDFQFSIFTSTAEIFKTDKTEFIVSYINHYGSAIISNYSAFSFSLRAPPFL